MVKNNYKKQKKVHFFEEPGPLDNQEHFKYLYEDRVGKSILRATKPGIKEGGYDTRFTSCCFEEKKHKKYLLDNLKVGRDIPADIHKQLIQIIKEYWCCFNPEAVKIPIRNYQAYIDTGNQKPITVQNTRYGLHESPIMQKAIDGLLANDQIEPATEGSWLS